MAVAGIVEPAQEIDTTIQKMVENKMPNDLNLCQFIGNLGADPEVRYTQNSTPVANIRIACNWKSKESEGVEWVRIVAFGGLAEVISRHLSKGQKIYVSGKMRTRQWQAQDGSDRYSTEVVANEMQMLDSRGGGGGDFGGQQGGGFQGGQGQHQGGGAPQGHPAPQGGGAFGDMDDDIPFN